MNSLPSDRDPFEQLVEAFLARYRAGERPSVSEYADQHPELAQQIRELLPALVVMEELRPGKGKPAGPGIGKVTDDGKMPRQLGEYRILREVGRGGMGVVYEAVQESLGRHVALKVLPFNSLISSMHLERFRREARAAARLHHTNIVPVFGVGEHEGIHYYAMQFIQGQGLDLVLQEVQRLRGPKAVPAVDGRAVARSVAEGLVSGQFSCAAGRAGGVSPLIGTAHQAVTDQAAADQVVADQGADAPPSSGSGRSDITGQSEAEYFRSVARLGVQVAEALEYAHRQGILHRDIKPSNLLLDTAGIVWVTDFGLAKAEDSEELTHPGDVVGTLRYMAPERLEGRSDPRSDIYSLGLTLYELLTLRPALDDGYRARLIERIRQESPPLPSKIDRRIPRDLETIVLKAIVKEPGGRYGTAEAMAEDLRRFLADRPIQARRSSWAEQAWRWCRRNPALAGLTATVALLLVVVALGSTTAAVMYSGIAEQERQARQDAEENKRELETNLYFSRIDLAHRELTAKLANPDRAEELLEACPPARRGWEWHYLKRLWRVEPIVLRDPGNDEFNSVAFGPDGQHVAAACRDKTVKVWDLKTGQVLTLRGHEKAVFSVAFSPRDGRRLASASLDKTVRVWDLTTRTEIFSPLPGREAHTIGMAQSVTFSPDGCWLAANSEGDSVRVWDATTGQLRHTLPGHEVRASLAFSPDGRVLASGNSFGIVRIWDAQTGRFLFPLTAGHIHAVSALAFSPDGRHLAAGCFGRRIDVWDATTGELVRTFSRHDGHVLGLAFSPDGSRLASTSADRSVRIWDVPAGQEVLQLRDHADWCQGLAFSPDGRLLASASRDRTIRLWDATPLTGNEGQEVLTFREHKDEVRCLAISPDGRRIASAGIEATVYVWDAKTGQVTQTFADFKQVVYSVAFSPDGHRLAAAGRDDVPSDILKVWDVQTGQPVLALRESRNVFCICFSPDSRWLALGLRDGTVKLCDARSGDTIGLVGKHDGEVRRLAFRHDGQRLASAGLDGAVKVWDVTRAWLPVHGLCTQAGCIATFPLSTTVQLELASWMESNGPPPLRTLPGAAGFWGVAYSPDGHRLLTVCADGKLTLWEADTGQEISHVGGQCGESQGSSPAFSPDGRWVASAAEDCTVKLWDATTLACKHSFRGHQGPIRGIAVSQKSDFLVTGSADKTVKVWKAPSLPESTGVADQ